MPTSPSQSSREGCRTPVRVLVSNNLDPYLNLATEDWIFNDMEPASKVLFLWRNEQSIIVGRGQNVWSECDLKKVEQDNVNIVRRQSGGGAVCQDPGNTCFTFMSAKTDSVPAKSLYVQNNDILIAALSALGIEAEASGRNDLVVNRDGQPFKISGSAFKEGPDRCFHHGTMLIDVDLERLGDYLTPDSKKLRSKGIKSVKSRVANLKNLNASISHQRFCDQVINSFLQHYGEKCEVEDLDASRIKRIAVVKAYYEKLKSREWVFGKNPQFQHTMKERFDWGVCELHLDTAKGKISDAKVYSDCLHVELADEFANFLSGKPYSREGVLAALTTHQESKPQCGLMLQDFYHWVANQIG